MVPSFFAEPVAVAEPPESLLCGAQAPTLAEKHAARPSAPESRSMFRRVGWFIAFIRSQPLVGRFFAFLGHQTSDVSQGL